MPKVSAGLLMYRICDGEPEFFLVHPGGPFWKNKDLGAWTIPKGELCEGENELACAQREFEEETGFKPKPPFIALNPITQKGGKVVHAWAFEDDHDPAAIKSNTFQMEWPPRSGKSKNFPEVDRAEFFRLTEVKEKINPAQSALLDELVEKLAGYGKPR
jgi:predicted NUDIX family NTP pyrophosphohydrolase